MGNDCGIFTTSPVPTKEDWEIFLLKFLYYCPITLYYAISVEFYEFK